jgi:hypothetical protein
MNDERLSFIIHRSSFIVAIMLLGFLTVVIMAICAYAYWREGVLTAFTMFVNVFLAGLLAFNFFEPVADLLDPMIRSTFLSGYEDTLALMVLFCASLGLLRLVTNNLAVTDVEYPPALWRGGGVLFGLAAGYLAAGFLACVMQTIPWHENFLGFDPKYDPEGKAKLARTVLPADRVWLGLMQRAGAYAFSNDVDEKPGADASGSLYDRYITFDRNGSFELRYARMRRYTDSREALPDTGDFDAQFPKKN